MVLHMGDPNIRLWALASMVILSFGPSEVGWGAREFLGLRVPLKQIEYGVYGDLVIIYPKPHSIYLRRTIGFRTLILEPNHPNNPH